ncbi:MAG: hypothetical protein H7Z41_10405 [Cytophagales bacterium]|nr:hypothetical protein [Armatimonadota bacterium]
MPERDIPPWSAPNAAALKAATRDAAVESLPGGYAAVLPAPFAAPVPYRDARYGWRYSRAVYVFAPVRKATGRNAPPPGLRLIVTVHHEPPDTARAQQTARLISRLLRLHFEHFGRDAAFPRDADRAEVWLASETPSGAQEAGGETRDNQVYFFATGSPRSLLEWTRTVVHEWGHLTMYAARGFTEPENDAGGFLGERLYLKWLWEEKTITAPLGDGVTRDGLDLYHERQIQPLIARFNKAGPAAEALGGMGQESMNYYIGGILASDSAYGSALTGRALRSIGGVRPRDFFAALRAERQAAAVRQKSRPKQKVSRR